ncbi:hypothetical protein CsSME_00025255 [Camellia sinensis var. sinensis]
MLYYPAKANEQVLVQQGQTKERQSKAKASQGQHIQAQGNPRPPQGQGNARPPQGQGQKAKLRKFKATKVKASKGHHKVKATKGKTTKGKAKVEQQEARSLGTNPNGFLERIINQYCYD